jgi:hypothetical protein
MNIRGRKVNKSRAREVYLWLTFPFSNCTSTVVAVKKWGGSGEDATVDEADAIDYTGEGI